LSKKEKIEKRNKCVLREEPSGNLPREILKEKRNFFFTLLTLFKSIEYDDKNSFVDSMYLTE